MGQIAILAYGSLIEEPGPEIAPWIRERRSGVETPFAVEFARRSATRDGAPALVPVESGGGVVQATLLVLRPEIAREEAQTLLWRRETRTIGSGQRYRPPSGTDPDQLRVGVLPEFAGIETVIFARFGVNLTDNRLAHLARYAIASAKTESGRIRRDGISYLASVKRHGIQTPVMPAYEREILKGTGASHLEEAWTRCQPKAAGRSRRS